jgi:outer membrane protein
MGDTWSLELSHGITNADQDYHAYYYTVKPEFATSDRESYEAKSGFSSRVTILTMKKRFGDFLLFPFLRYENLEGSVIEDSPLVKQTDYYFYGLGLFYLFI